MNKQILTGRKNRAKIYLEFKFSIIKLKTEANSTNFLVPELSPQELSPIMPSRHPDIGTGVLLFNGKQISVCVNSIEVEELHFF